MKTLTLTLAVVFSLFASSVWAAEIWRSSYTATADSLKNLCGPDGGQTRTRRGVFHGIVVSSGVAGASACVYASSATASNPITCVDSSSECAFYFDTIAISTSGVGLTYSTVGTANTTFLYNCQ